MYCPLIHPVLHPIKPFQRPSARRTHNGNSADVVTFGNYLARSYVEFVLRPYKNYVEGDPPDILQVSYAECRRTHAQSVLKYLLKVMPSE